MTVFKDTAQLYAVGSELFATMQNNHAHALRSLFRSRLVARLTTSDPAGEFLVDARNNPLRTVTGPTSERADLEIVLSADTLHRILLGELSLPKALGSGQLQARGAIFKAVALAELFVESQKVYPQIARTAGIM